MITSDFQEINLGYLDIETTGLDPFSGDRICEIALLKTKGDKVVDRIGTLINPGRAIPPMAASINRITDEMVEKAPFFRDIALSLIDFMKDTTIVAHNARFDLEFLSLEFNNIKLTPPENRVIDTLGIARRYYKFQSNSLGDIARYLGISTMTKHRAFADVRITKEVFEYFLKDLKRRGIRIHNLKDILKLPGRSLEFKKPSDLVLPPEIERAIGNKGKLKIRYLSAYSDTTTTRIIEPIEVNLNRSNTYVLAYCHLRKERCNFRLDRILEIRNVT